MLGKAVRGIGAILIAAGLVLASTPAALGADRIYWGNGNDTISYADLDGSGGNLLNLDGATPSGPRGVAIDSAAGRIYWANQGNDTISYANLDGSGGGGELNIAGAAADRPHGLAIDPAAGRIYWANDDDTIAYASLDGTGGDLLDITGSTPAGPYGLAVEPATGKIYWANRDTNTISYAALDGSGGGGELNVTGAPISKPHGVTTDPAGGKIYWTNLESTIGYANLDGSGSGGQLDTTGANDRGGIGMAIDSAEGLMYWGNLGSSNISFTRLHGSGGGLLNTSGSESFQSRFVSLILAPSAAGAPQIAGGSATGSVLTCSQGTWATDIIGAFLYRAPQSVAHQWLKDGSAIAGATASSYTPESPGSYSCRETATNHAGATAQTSSPVNVALAGAAKCKKLREKRERQRRALTAVRTDKKHSEIQANIKDANRRLKRLGCKKLV